MRRWFHFQTRMKSVDQVDCDPAARNRCRRGLPDRGGLGIAGV